MNSIKFKSLFLVLTLAALPLVAAAAGPDPHSIYVESIGYGGSGTPQGTVGQSISDDRTVYTLIFDSFIASQGPGVPITESRKNSQIDLNLHGPGHAVLATDIRGYIQLPAGAKAVLTLRVEDSKGHGKTFTQTFRGPVARDYTVAASSKVKVKSQASPESLLVQIAIQGAGVNQAQATVDSIDGQLTQSKGGHGGGDDCDEDDDDDDNDDGGGH